MPKTVMPERMRVKVRETSVTMNVAGVIFWFCVAYLMLHWAVSDSLCKIVPL